MAQNKKNLRRQSVIDARVQWTLAMRMVLQLFVFMLAACFFGLMVQFLKNRDGGIGAVVGRFWENYGIIIAALVCLIPAFIRDTLRMSNRIAGPIHNLHRVCKQIADGDTEVRPLKFREDDMWQYVPDDFNRMVDRLKDNDDQEAVDIQQHANAESPFVSA